MRQDGCGRPRPDSAARTAAADESPCYLCSQVPKPHLIRTISSSNANPNNHPNLHPHIPDGAVSETTNTAP